MPNYALVDLIKINEIVNFPNFTIFYRIILPIKTDFL